MIDKSLFRSKNPHFISALKNKDPQFDVEKLIELDQRVRDLQVQVEQLRHKKNELAEKGKTGVSPELIQQSKDVSLQLKDLAKQLEVLESEFLALYLYCPNVPAADVPVGTKDANEVVKIIGNKKQFSFPVKNHVELGNKLGWFDFEAAAAMTGAQFALYKNDAVKLLYSLSMFMLKNNIKHGYQPILPPVLITQDSLLAAGHFPKFKDQVYAIEEDELYLTPTSEVNLTNLYRNTILNVDQLPIRLTALTSCFRREAGGYGAHERGLIRIHQFEKVEIYTLCEPKDGQAELEKMLACAEDILQQLGLHYRVSLLATQDMSFQAAKTYDIEVWLPGQDAFYEVSSVSLCTDFQARRSAIRYRPALGKKPEYVYTLNGSSLALPRLMVAIMETYQREDGTIEIPEILKAEGIW